ncbi:MAG: hypothetical protein IJ489_11040 [Clostridia bacterium]|nr:hypothetical protein [Clostridia bacterium]
MKIGNRILSFCLAIVFFVSVFAVFPPMEVRAANTKPTAVTVKVSNITDNSITICGKITANGGAVITEYGFCYGLEGGSKTEYKVFKGSLEKGKIVTFTISNLKPGDAIWYEFYAKNSVGESKGKMMFSEIPEEEFEISEDELEFDAEGGKDTFYVYSSNSWSISDDQSWISVSQTSGSSDKQITVTCKENTTAKDRDGTITVTNKSTKEKLTIDVYQEAAELETEFDFSEFEISEEVVLGEDLTWEGYVYIENDVFDNVTISLKKVSDGNYIYYRKTSVGGTKFDTEKILNGSITTGKKAPSGHQLDSNGEWYTYNNFAIDEAGEYLLYITASGKNTGEYEKKEYSFTVTEPEEKDPPEVELDVNPTTITLGESFTYSGTAYGNDYDLNTVTVGISYFTSESNYEREIGESVYLRNTGLSKEEFSVSGTIETGFGKSIKGTDNVSSKEVILPTDRAGIYTVTLHGYSEEYGTDVEVHVKIYVNDVSSKTVGDLDGDGAITNKDRFILNRYLEKMTGYTSIDKNVADINGDGDVTAADADYLTRHLAGWLGYEKLPEPPISGVCTHGNSIHVYKSTIFVNNKIKTNAKHYYYHIWDVVCQDCGETVNTIQDEKMGEKAHEFNADGVCSCGAIDTSGYKSWTGINATNKRVSVYDTPYSTDGSYGQLFVDEQVTVLGKKAGRYLVQYAIKGGTKQGYVPANAIKTYSSNASEQYSIQFTFETITLPVSGREVLLIPKNSSATYELYQGKTKIAVDKSKLKIDFQNQSACSYDTAKIEGHEGGFGTLAVSYTVNGKTYHLQCPDFYIVADSASQKHLFSQDEKDYIRMALDIYFSQNMINVPYELYFSGWENFWLCVEELDKIVTSLDAHTNDYASILERFIEEYAVRPEVAKLTTDEQDKLLGLTVGEYLDVFIYIATYEKDALANIQVASQLKDLIVSIEKLSKTAATSMDDLKQLLCNLRDIFRHEGFKEMLKAFPKLQELTKKSIKNGLPTDLLGNKLTALVKSSKFWKVVDGVFEKLDVAGTVIEAGMQYIEFTVTVFGNWERHREFLSAMLVAIDSIPEENRKAIKEYDILRESVVKLLDKYDENFGKRLVTAAIECKKDLAVIGLKFLLGHFCPGAAAILALAQLGAGLSDVREEADVNRMIQFYVILREGVMNNFETLYEEGETFSTIYSFGDDLTYLFLKMAVCANDWTQYVSDRDYSKAEKKIFENNIKTIENKFKCYLH